ncbi:TPA: hypothetical protein U1344_002282, partial [Streptococcus suis]|nr:hypothetical protein [Streptococcus suis]
MGYVPIPKDLKKVKTKVAPPVAAFQVGTVENQLLDKIINIIQAHSNSNIQGKQQK